MCVHLEVTGSLLALLIAGICSMIVGPCSTKLPQSLDIESDQLGVPHAWCSGTPSMKFHTPELLGFIPRSACGMRLSHRTYFLS